MLKLYSAPATRSIRIAWLLEEMGVEYEVANREFVNTGTKFYLQDTPTGKFPTLDDDGTILFESGAIAEYLLEKFPDHELAPRIGDADRGEFLQWMYFADATAFAPIGMVVWMVLYRDDAEENAALIKDASNRARTGLEILETHLSNREYLLERGFSAADIMMGFTLIAARTLNIFDDASQLNDYLGRLTAREAFVRAADKTGNQT